MLDDYRNLGRSGLLVSPFGLGTMTFGRTPWGCDAGTSREILDLYLSRGGNLIDTADVYGSGASEEIIGGFLADRRNRDDVVLATKFTLGGSRDDPNSFGNSRKAILRALDRSLRRLRTDYIDLYQLHAWDGVTPVEEVMSTLDYAVRSGKVRYLGLSNVPSWYASRAHTIAEWRGYEPLIALQVEYSLVERTIEYEFPALCREIGTGLMAWSPLGNGFLTGKYSRSASETARGRLDLTNETTSADRDKRTERNWEILHHVTKLAARLDVTVPQLALSWVLRRPMVSTVLVGATKPAQLAGNFPALDLNLADDEAAELDRLTEPPYAVPHGFLRGLQVGLRASSWLL